MSIPRHKMKIAINRVRVGSLHSSTYPNPHMFSTEGWAQLTPKMHIHSCKQTNATTRLFDVHRKKNPPPYMKTPSPSS